MATVKRVACTLLALLIVSCLPPTVVAASAVELDNPIWLAESDLGLEVLAAGGESSQKVLVAGADGYARLLDGTDPNVQIGLASPTTETIRAIDWHPRGKTALLVGDNGAMLRYAAEDHSVTTVSGSGALNGVDIAAVAWNAAGSVAYVGGEGGWIWAYHEGADGIGVFELIVNESGSLVTGIACLDEEYFCAVTTESDGIFIIDSNSNHAMYFLGKEDTRWLGINCADSVGETCVAIGEGRAIAQVDINTIQPERSGVPFVQTVWSLSGEFTHVHTRSPRQTLVTMSPFQIMAWDMEEVEAYEWVEYSDISERSDALAGERLIGSWATVDNANIGFVITSYGAVIGFHPAPVTSVWTDSLISYILGAVVLIVVPGVVLGLIFMNSETLQRKYYDRRNAKREAAEKARVAKEKAQKKAARKGKKA
jgi:hypothetical protein